VTRVEVIRPFVEQTVKEFLGVDELKVMEDGTIPIRAGSSAVNVRLLEGPTGGHPLLRVSSPLLHGVPSSPELLTKLNEMNAAFSFARAFVLEDRCSSRWSCSLRSSPRRRSPTRAGSSPSRPTTGTTSSSRASVDRRTSRATCSRRWRTLRPAPPATPADADAVDDGGHASGYL
jgi:hypothetical protein